MTTQVDLEVVRGDDAVFDIIVRDQAGKTVNLSGGTLRFTARDGSDDDDPVVISKQSPGGGIVFTDATNGYATLTLAKGDTSPLYAPYALVYDCEFTAANGNVTTVLPAGVLYIRRDVTHS